MKEGIDPGVNVSVKYISMLNGKANLILRNGPSKEVENAVEILPFGRLTLKYGNWRDLSFLLKHKKKIIELVVLENNCDWSVISDLTALRSLRIGGWFNTNLKFDKLENLVRLNTYHNKGYDDSLYSLPKLKFLKIIGWKGENFEKMESLRRLEGVHLVDGRRLQSCNGLENLQNLRYLEMYAMRNLVDADSLGKSQVSCLKLECCKKIKEFNFTGLSP